MNAIQSSKAPLHAVESRRVARTQNRRRTQPHRGFALETTAKLVVNVALSAAATSALAQLLPYHWSVQAKLQEIRTEVKQTEERVNHVKQDFSRSFDPQEAKSVMREQSHRIDPTRRQIVLLDNQADELDRAEDSASP